MSIRQNADDVCPTANKRRRTDEDGSVLTFRRRLYAMLKEGSFTDVELLVATDNDKVKRLPAHKIILAAMSSVFATKMTQRWGEGGQGRDVIEIPPDVGMEAVEKFLEFLYTDELETDLNVKLCLDLIFLADHYEVENLLTLCDGILIEKLDVGNCIQIYEKSRLFQAAKCGNISFNLLKKNFGRILTSASNKWMQINGSTWKAILETSYLPNIEEIELFKGLKRWKDENVEERASDFKKLIKLIRLPLVGVENFAEFVAPSGELDDKLMMEMFIYFAKKGPVPEPFENPRPRNLLEPKDSEELQKLINECQNGDIIELDGNYSSFVIPENKTNLSIRAKAGKEAMIKAYVFGIKIKGQLCKIEGLSISFNPKESRNYKTYGVELDERASGNILDNITITGASYGLYIYGNDNTISNITINDPAKTGIHLADESSANDISKCSILNNEQSREPNGFVIGGNGGNKLSNLNCINSKCNKVHSSGNFIKGLDISGDFFQPVLILLAGSNHVENVNILGKNAAFRVDHGNNKIINCCMGMIRIRGEGHKLENCHAKKISVGGKRHKFNKCEAQLLKLKNGAEIESNGCVFHLTERV